MHFLIHVLGLDNPTGAAYLFWSGFGGFGLALASGVVGFLKLKKQRERHHQQLKHHLDYKFAKLTDEEAV